MRSTQKGYPEIRVAFSLTKLSMTYPLRICILHVGQHDILNLFLCKCFIE